ncbi:integrase core domain-containing protein [Nonomuraea sp. NPDC049714]|uniref:integrase core domain-containing protein n=1 Tax=Nonomuraea sp. NPDC049714 TaxID=3364357 RepID=UPI00379DE98E
MTTSARAAVLETQDGPFIERAAPVHPGGHRAASRRVRVLSTTENPNASRVLQAIKNMVMELEEAGRRARYLIRDRDAKFPALMDEIHRRRPPTVLTGIRVPRMNAVMERWVQSCRRELLDRCMIWNERRLRHALREYERFYNQHRAHQALVQAAPLRAVPDPITDPNRMANLAIRRRDRLGGVLHEYSDAA